MLCSCYYPPRPPSWLPLTQYHSLPANSLHSAHSSATSLHVAHCSHALQAGSRLNDCCIPLLCWCAHQLQLPASLLFLAATHSILLNALMLCRQGQPCGWAEAAELEWGAEGYEGAWPGQAEGRQGGRISLMHGRPIGGTGHQSAQCGGL